MNSQAWLKQGAMLVVMLVMASALSVPFAPADWTRSMQADAHWGEMPLYFIANQGQLDDRVAYYVQGSDKTLYFTPEGVTFALTNRTTSRESTPAKGRFRAGFSARSSEESRGASERWIVKLDFVGANAVRPSGQAQSEAIISYFKGSPAEWRSGLPTYSKIVYPDLWAGIDLAYSGTVDRLKHEFVVRPGADPAQIRLAYRGASVRLNDAGQLEVSTPAGGFQDDAPVAYQEVNGQRMPVFVEYVLDDAPAPGVNEPHSYGFHVGTYNPSLPLVIDPQVLVYCGYIGGENGDFGTSIAVDQGGYAFVTGYTDSEITFPVTAGPDLTYNGITDAFVAKVKADGTGLVYAGYIGGNYYDYGYGIAVDSDGNAYVTGDTLSTEASFPVLVGPDLTFNGSTAYRDAFIAKVNPDGTGLLYAGYIGGTGHETAYAIALDSQGNAYVTGLTGSFETSFPVAVGPDVTKNGLIDAFVAKVKANGTGLVYAGYIGGSDIQEGWGIAVDTSGYAYVTGITSSTEDTFPVAVGPDLTYNGGPTTSPWDAFVAKIEADGTGLAYCGYIGGVEQDYGSDVGVDASGNAYVTGYTNSTQASFPVLVGPDLTYNGDYWDVFVTKVKPDGSGLLYSGYIGGDEGEVGAGIAVDASGNAYIAGWTSSTQATFPVIVGPDLTHNGYHDAFVAKVKADGTQLLYAGYIGGSSGDSASGIAIDAAGNAYVTGDTCTDDGSFPAIVGPDLTYNDASGYYDAFVAKVAFRAATKVTFNSASAQDGWILETGEKTNKGGALNKAATAFYLGDNAQKRQYRSFLSFSTRNLPDDAVITKITLKVRKQGLAGGGNPVATFQGFMVDVKQGFFGSAAGLQASDFQTKATQSYGPFKPALKNGWYTLDLSPASVNINRLASGGGVTQIRLRFKLDDNNNAVANYLSLYSGNAPAASRPQLIVEYYVP
jgi:hypothetical protein